MSNIRKRYKLKTRYQRLREQGMISADELATKTGVNRQTVERWRKHGAIQAHAYSDKGGFLYDPAEQGLAPSPRWPRRTAH